MHTSNSEVVVFVEWDSQGHPIFGYVRGNESSSGFSEIKLGPLIKSVYRMAVLMPA